MSDSVWPQDQQPTRLLCPWDSPGKNTGVGCHCLLQYILHLLYAFICRWTFRLFPCLSIINSVAMNIEVHVSFQIIVLPECMSQSGPAGSYGNSIFVFWETSILFSTVATPVYIPTKRVWRFPFLHIPANTCHLSFLVLALLTVLFWPDTDLHGGHKELDTTEQLRTNN